MQRAALVSLYGQLDCKHDLGRNVPPPVLHLSSAVRYHGLYATGTSWLMYCGWYAMAGAWAVLVWLAHQRHFFMSAPESSAPQKRPVRSHPPATHAREPHATGPHIA